MLVLGINHSNDSAACIVRDGEVLGATQEERFSRSKHECAFPTRAIEFCLQRAGARLEDVDAVGFFWNPGVHAQTFSYKQSAVPRHHMEFLYSVPNHLLRAWRGDTVAAGGARFFLKSGRTPRGDYVPPPLAPAASTPFLAAP